MDKTTLLSSCLFSSEVSCFAIIMYSGTRVAKVGLAKDYYRVPRCCLFLTNNCGGGVVTQRVNQRGGEHGGQGEEEKWHEHYQ